MVVPDSQYPCTALLYRQQLSVDPLGPHAGNHILHLIIIMHMERKQLMDLRIMDMDILRALLCQGIPFQILFHASPPLSFISPFSLAQEGGNCKKKIRCDRFC